MLLLKLWLKNGYYSPPPKGTSLNILGTKQSGHIEFKFVDLYKDKELCDLAYKSEYRESKFLLSLFEYEGLLEFI